MKRNYFALIFLFVAMFATQGFAQSAATASTAQKHELDSKLMARKMPYNVILPQTYNEKSAENRRFGVLYLLHGLTGSYENWATRTKLSEYAKAYDLIIVMPEGENGWYTDSPVNPNDKYETYITDELIPEIDKKYRPKSDRSNRMIAGLSMGGYGALKFGIKYPERFSFAGSFSGALSIPTDGWTFDFVRPSIKTAFGEANSPTVKSNDIYALIKDMPEAKVKELPYFYFDCGTEDFLIKPNRDFAALLLTKKIPYEYRELPGKHDWKYWDAQVQEFLRIAARMSAK